MTEGRPGTTPASSLLTFRPPLSSWLKTMTTIERSLIEALHWMPYPSDLEDAHAREQLGASLAKISDGLDAVRAVKKATETAILSEAMAE